jgi:hypothetical protein
MSNEQLDFDAHPPMGPLIATPVAANEVAAPGHRRLYPMGERAPSTPDRKLKNEKGVTPQPKSVTYVLNHECYPCPDQAVTHVLTKPLLITHPTDYGLLPPTDY